MQWRYSLVEIARSDASQEKGRVKVTFVDGDVLLFARIGISSQKELALNRIIP